MTMDLIKKSFDDARQVLEAFMADGEKLDEVRRAGDLLVDMYRRGGKVFSCGNGGSLCDAMHFAEELTGRFRRDRDALPALAIADPSHLTCVANDMGYEEGFARYVKALGNVIAAVEAAKERGMQVIGLTGKDGGQLKALCDVAVVVPWNGYSDRIQEVHIKIIHIWIEYIEQALFQER